MENQNRVGRVLLLLAGFFLVLCVGMAIGGVLVYGVTRIVDVKTQTQVETFGLRLDDQSGEPSLEVVTPGASIVDVMAGSPAERAGLQEGDLILAVDGQQVGPLNDLASLIGRYEPGDRVTLTVQSPDQKSRRVQVKLGENADRPGAPYLGVRYSSAQPNLSPQGEALPFDFDQLPMPRGRGMQGLVVMEVTEGSPAARAGLAQGDVIVAIDGQSLDSPQALVDAVQKREPGERVTLTVLSTRDLAEQEVEVILGEHPDRLGAAYLGVTIGGGFRFFGLPGSEGGEIPPGFEFRWGQNRFGMPLDQLPFNLDELPGNWEEFQRQFEFQAPPGTDDNSL